MKTMMLTAACLISISACENAELFDNLLRGSPMDGGSGRMVSDLAMKPPDLRMKIPNFDEKDTFDPMPTPEQADLQIRRGSGSSQWNWLLLDVPPACEWKIGIAGGRGQSCPMGNNNYLTLNIFAGELFPTPVADRCSAYAMVSPLPEWPAENSPTVSVTLKRANAGMPDMGYLPIFPEEGTLHIGLLDKALNIKEEKQLQAAVETYSFGTITYPILGIAILYKHNPTGESSKKACFQVTEVTLDLKFNN